MISGGRGTLPLILRLAPFGLLFACSVVNPKPFSGNSRSSNSAQLNSTAAVPLTAEQRLFASLPHGTDAMAVLCGGDDFPHDDVAGVFCQPNVPTITGLKDLLSVLKIGFANTTTGNGVGGNPSFVLQGHSSALARSEVSALMPQALIFKNLNPAVAVGAPNAEYVAIAFTRGPTEMVEIVTHDPVGNEAVFYVVKFYQACDLTGTCTMADYYSPSVEQNWVAYDVYENEPNLQNTVLDCFHCHNPAGPGVGTSFLRLQENTAPYTHFFSSQTQGGNALLADFHAIHGTREDYGGIPAALIDQSQPALIASFVNDSGFPNQPNAFNSAAIEAEVNASSPQQPLDNLLAGTSATWNATFKNYTQGLAIPPPYHDVKVTDPKTIGSFTQAYLNVINKIAPPSSMPDFEHVYPSSPTLLAQMGLRAFPGSTPQEIMVNACMQCHQPNLDQGISRAKFTVNNLLNGTMDATEKQIAIDRINADPNSIGLMPPRRFKTLTDLEKQALVNYLKQ